MTTTPGWVDQPTPEEEGQRKSDGNGSGYRMSGGGGGWDSVHNIGVDPQLRIMEKLGDIMAAAHSNSAPCMRMVGIYVCAIIPRDDAPGIARDHTRSCRDIVCRT